MNTDTIIILGNGFDRDLGFDLTFKSYRNNHLCGAHELDKLNPKGDKWSDFETELRSCILDWKSDLPNAEDRANDINKYWQYFWKFFSVFITEQTQDYPLKKEVNKNCAYELLETLKSNNIVYTFNYTYPYEYTTLKPICEFKFVHGRYYKDGFTDMAIMSQSPQMILGIDYELIPAELRENDYFKPIIKKNHPEFKGTDIKEKLSKASTVIFFGHSLGITDSDYFKKFFEDLQNNKNQCERVFIITLDKCSYEGIIERAKTWGVDLKGNDKIIPIYTDKGPNSRDFKKVLSYL